MFETPVKGSQYPAALSFLMGQGKLTRTSPSASSTPPR